MLFAKKDESKEDYLQKKSYFKGWINVRVWWCVRLVFIRDLTINRLVALHP
jgi:hypothetical protein